MRHNKPIEIPRAQRERMFGFWCENERNYAKTARHFNRAITTVRRVSDKEEWPQRADDIDKKIRDRIDGRVVANEVSNIRLVRNLKKKMAKQLFDKPDLDVTVRDFIALLRYEDELAGNLPDREDSDRHYTFNFGDLSDDDRNRIRRELGGLWSTTSANRL